MNTLTHNKQKILLQAGTLYRCNNIDVYIGEYIHTCSQKGVSVPMQPNLSYRLYQIHCTLTSTDRHHKVIVQTEIGSINIALCDNLHTVVRLLLFQSCMHKYHSNTRKFAQENCNNLGPCVLKQNHRLLHIPIRSIALLGGNNESTMVKVALIFYLFFFLNLLQKKN